MIEVISIDLSNYCSKECSFCYNHSKKDGNVMWKPQEVIEFCRDCISCGVRAVSLGGGEPFEYDGIFEIIDALYPECYLSITTNGLPLKNNDVWQKLMLHKPDKIHITIHNPDNYFEVDRVMKQVVNLGKTSIKPGVNLLVGADKTESAHKVYQRLRTILNENQIIIIPQRFYNTPTPKQLAEIAEGRPFQSTYCLVMCKKPSNFASVSWDKKANFCSYAPCKEQLMKLDYQALTDALSRVKWKSCM